MVDVFYPITKLADIIVTLLFSSLSEKPKEIIAYFIEDVLKIIALLYVMIFVTAYLRTYLPKHKIKRWLSGKKGGIGNLLAAIFGAITPFCSCSSIPIFISFIETRIPLGIAFSFLITSPLVNEYLVVLMLGLFGWKITAAYVASGILVGVIAGLILGKMNLEKELVQDLIARKTELDIKDAYKTQTPRLKFALGESKAIVKKIWVWIIAGVGIGSIIHNIVPQDTIQSVVKGGGIFTVPLATLIGVPFYANCSAVVPIALALFQKGVPIGTALAFLMGIAGLSFPEAVILRRAMKLKLIMIFFAVVTAAIIFTGYLLNALQPLLI